MKKTNNKSSRLNIPVQKKFNSSKAFRNLSGIISAAQDEIPKNPHVGFISDKNTSAPAGFNATRLAAKIVNLAKTPAQQKALLSQIKIRNQSPGYATSARESRVDNRPSPTTAPSGKFLQLQNQKKIQQQQQLQQQQQQLRQQQQQQRIQAKNRYILTETLTKLNNPRHQMGISLKDEMRMLRFLQTKPQYANLATRRLNWIKTKQAIAGGLVGANIAAYGLIGQQYINQKLNQP